MSNTVWERDADYVFKKFKIFILLKIFFLCVLDRFDMMISKIIFKK